MSEDTVKILKRYFPELTPDQTEAYLRMEELYAEWNARINVVSRNDIDNLFERHILHSLSIGAMLGPLAEGTKIMDLGTGGGFPGIPLAVLYPHCQFHLIDRIGKKIRVASEIAHSLGLTNIEFQHGDAGECHSKFDYVVSRAVMALDGLVKIARRNVLRTTPRKNRYSPGLICLKGGDLHDEIEATGNIPVLEIPVTEFINLPCFDTKQIIYVPL